WRVKLIDFGLALKQEVLQKTIQSPAGSDKTVVGRSIAGTLDYAAPEQMGRLPGASLGPHSDVYGFGRTCYFALLGTPNPDHLQKKQLDSGWKTFLEDCTANPEHRIPDFGMVLKRLGTLKNVKTPAGAKTPGKSRREPRQQPDKQASD